MKVVDFWEVREFWGSEYKLSDGNRLFLKVILTKVVDTGNKKPTGEPLYNVEFQVVVRVEEPESVTKNAGHA